MVSVRQKLRVAVMVATLGWLALGATGLGSPAQAADGSLGFLAASDRALYREIFLLQDDGKWEESAQLIARLQNPILLGHVIEQRLMHPTDYRSPFVELRDWLAAHGDHPGALRVYKLAMRRKPAAAPAPRKPEAVRRTHFAPSNAEEEAGDTTGAESKAATKAASVRILTNPGVIRGETRAARKVLAQVRINVRRERLTSSEKYVRGAEGRSRLSDAEFGESLSRIAAGWLRWGSIERAESLAREGVALGGAHYPLGYWTAGLAAWELGKTEAALEMFAPLAKSEIVSAEWRARGAWWAGRAALRLRRVDESTAFLRLAAAEADTLYGLLASTALGLQPEAATSFASRLEFATLASSQRVLRAVALLEAGRLTRAEAELAQLGVIENAEFALALLGLAEHAGLPRLALTAATGILAEPSLALSPEARGLLLSSLYPVPPWSPQGGFLLDRALLYAIAREESRFNANAVSNAGARGAMQILPSTAAFITNDSRFRSRSGKRALHDPNVNVWIGQLYLLHLMANQEAGTDLLRVLTAYNGGPGNLRRWNARLEKVGIDAVSDPLLYLERIPSAETRKYCTRVLLSLWRYRARFGQKRPALEQLAAGRVAHYTPQDEARRLSAR